MKDFDQERDKRTEKERQFKIGGDVFTFKPAVPPEALFDWFDMGAGTSERDAIAIIDQLIVSFLESGQEERWAAVRSADAKNPITNLDLLELVRWLIAEQTGRPTQPPSDSSDGPETTTTISTEGSPSVEETSKK